MRHSMYLFPVTNGLTLIHVGTKLKKLQYKFLEYTGVPKKEDESVTPLFIGGF
jgi:hypothetical protein